ncbi:MAG: DNA-directed RNA polymerase subunit delta [Bacilli bacterium]|nr:DNA-directed RNA polymerase subunit delta [Bacilli bacterium]
MKLKDYKKDELELMGYDDIAIIVLQESGKKMKIADIFKKICDALEMSESEYENRIGDFFELLSTNKNFIMLENGFWDLKSKHNSKVVIDEEEEVSEVLEEDEEELEETEEEDIFYENDDDDDIVEDDLNDLVIIDMDEEEAEM